MSALQWGDTTHGKGRHNRLFETLFSCEPLLLAAAALRFHHPYRAHAIMVSAPLDPVMDSVLAQLGWADALSISRPGFPRGSAPAPLARCQPRRKPTL